jgi:predicted GIY-YIG superfamily endonuclease
MLLYQKAITNKISRLLAKYNIKTVHNPWKKNIHMLRPVKDDLGLKVHGVYRIPCECDKAYAGQTGRFIEARCKEHIRHVRLKEPDKSTVVEHNFNTRHRTDFSSTSVLDKTTGYIDRLVKEAI